MLSDAAIQLFKILEKRIGDTVILKMWMYGVPQEVTGILRDVTSFQDVTLDCGVFPFVGNGRAIEEIIAINSRGERVTVYTNPGAKGYNIRSAMEASNVKREMLGYSPELEHAVNHPVERDVHLGHRR